MPVAGSTGPAMDAPMPSSGGVPASSTTLLTASMILCVAPCGPSLAWVFPLMDGGEGSIPVDDSDPVLGAADVHGYSTFPVLHGAAPLVWLMLNVVWLKPNIVG